MCSFILGRYFFGTLSNLFAVAPSTTTSVSGVLGDFNPGSTNTLCFCNNKNIIIILFVFIFFE